MLLLFVTYFHHVFEALTAVFSMVLQKALATSVLTTELQQPSTSKTFTLYLYCWVVPLAAVLYSTETTNYVPSERLFGVDWKHLHLRRRAIIVWIEKALSSQLSSSDPS